MFKKILVGNDGSEHAADAIARALEIAGRYKAELVVAHVAQIPAAIYVGAPYAPIDINAEVERSNTTAAEKAKAVLDAHSANARYIELQGSPADALCKLAEEEDADLIVVGSRGLGAVTRFVLGSVSDRIVHHAPCDVLVVRGEA